MISNKEETNYSKKAYFVLLGSCIIFFLTSSYISIFGLLYQDLIRQISLEDEWVGTYTFGTFLFMWNFTSLFVGPLCLLRSHRWTLGAGLLLMVSGVFLSAFSKSAMDLCLSVGVIVGSGKGLTTNTAIIVLTHHFKENRLGLAIGVSFLIMGISGIIAPQFVMVLLRHFSSKISIIVYGCVMLLSVISLLVINEGPFKTSLGYKGENTSKEEDDDILRIKSPINYNDDELVAQSHLCSKDEGHLLNSHKTVSYKANSEPEEHFATQHINPGISNHNVHCNIKFHQDDLQTERLTDDQEGNVTNSKPCENELEMTFSEKIKNFILKNPIVKMFTLIQWTLMRSPYFLITMIGSSFSFSAILNYFLLLPLLCKEFGLSEDKTSILLSATNASDVLFRLVFAWAGDWECSKEIFCGKPRRILYAISVLGLSIFMIGITFVENFSGLLCCCIFYGICASGIPGNGPLVYTESFKDVASAMGLASIGRCLTSFSMAPLIELLKESSNGSVRSSFWLCGGISILCMIVWIVEACFNQHKLERRRKEESEMSF